MDGERDPYSRSGKERCSNPARKSNQVRYDHFGETIRYLTYDELQKFFDTITDYRHKLMMRLIYELGCRVGEFVRIQLKHLDFQRSAVLFPAENTKTGKWRVSFVPWGPINEVQGLLRQEGRTAKRDGQIRKPDSFLFYPPCRPKEHYSENRIRQITRRYLRIAGLEQSYALDSRGRSLHRLTVHSLRHSHLMHYIHIHKLPLSVVQKQVGHKTLKATSVYLRPSDEAVAAAYQEAHSLPALDPQYLATTSPQNLNSWKSLSPYHDRRQSLRKRNIRRDAGASVSNSCVDRGKG